MWKGDKSIIAIINNNFSHLPEGSLLMKLSQLQVGQQATISNLSELSTDVRKKLMVMGLLPKTEVKLIRKAPLGDPLQIEVRGVSMAVRTKIADSVTVEVK